MSDVRPINLSTQGLPTTVMALADPAALAALADAVARPADEQRAAVAAVVARWPRFIAAWAELGARGRDDIEQYAAYRVGYHRGLDALRASGWRGSGYVRWAEESNRGFLRALRGLGQVAAKIGELDEAERIALFLQQLDPSGVPEHG